ncbi:MAG: hypothetical protein AVDCRST_MAG44-384 [uncultured Sphingomonas sp.]|uniref:DUF2007 domain-containing protein n=1 Tax=uncultured Sphingomonas sp. TaxID=158754 RepID=A0A6J4SAR7_9SPHN|nr:MAG: hypothetical protein AVDCRST_MAG44-384 [uncultured Sphingomonas sp.]
MSGLAEVARYQSRIDADVARLFLIEEGIDAVLFDAEINSFYGGLFMPVRLMVFADELERALELLDGAAP